MQELSFKPKGVCASEIKIKIDNGIIISVQFKSGCNGNLQGISRLVDGMPAREAIERLKGIDCLGRGTSCPDQLSIALEKMLEKGNDGAA